MSASAYVSIENSLPTLTNASTNLGNALVEQTVTLDTTQLISDLGAIDIDGNTLSIVGLTSNGDGTLTDNNNGTWSYSVAATDKTNATVTFNFEVSDGIGDTVFASAELNIENSSPYVDNSFVSLGSSAVGETLTLDESTLLTESSANDIDGDTLNVENITSSGNGNLTDNGNGTWSYVSVASDIGTVSFDFDISDGLDSTNAEANC